MNDTPGRQSTSVGHQNVSIAKRVDDLMLLSEIVNQFMAVSRSGIMDGRYETDGEHTLRLQFVAVAYAQRYHPELDSTRVGLYALVHDFVEVYAGDVNSLQADEAQMAAKAEAEQAALQQLDVELGDSWPDLIQLIRDYESLESIEARFVKCFDKCDPVISHIQNRGEALARIGVTDVSEFATLYGKTTHRMKAYSQEFPDVVAIRDELHERTKKILRVRYNGA